jgi:hypothetical protein
VNAGKKRLGKIVQRLRSETTSHKRCDRLVVTGQSRHKDFARHAELATPAEKRRTGQGCEADGEAKERPFRQRSKHTSAKNVRSARRSGRDKPILQSQFAAERDAGWLLYEQRIGSRIDNPSVEPFGVDDAARAIRRFEQTDIESAKPELIGGCQAGDATADDGDVNSRGYLPRLETL